MLMSDVIRTKRDGGTLSAGQIAFFVDGLADGSIPAEQVSALAMAVYLRGMDFEEAAELTSRMAASGSMLRWDTRGLGGPVADKHSTGGVGDKVSFLLAPIVAACGCYVPMISGRGLGHSGGTLDKIESIPGYDSTPSLERFREVVADVGCAIIGQTGDLAPADRRFYAIRDITGTVESVPLITASILSKKIAAGNEGLVMDVKWGSGAFMSAFDDAVTLAETIIATAAKAGLETRALITDMNETLGHTAGNALEIAECVEYLTGGERERRLDEVVLALSAEMLVMTGLAEDSVAGLERADAALASGKAAETFGRMIAALGAPRDFLERAGSYLPSAAIRQEIYAEREGYLCAVDARAIGNAIIELGGGRRRTEDRLDLSVGFSAVSPIGSRVGPAGGGASPLAIVHAATERGAEQAARDLRAACTIQDSALETRPVVNRRLAGD